MRLGDQNARREAWLRLHGPHGTDGALRGGAPTLDSAGRLVPKDAPHPGADWVPLGPTVATGGQASDRPGVTGRVRSIAFAPGGQRGYAGTAGGGAWMTLDAGETWQPLDPWRDTPNAALAFGAGGLVVGSLGAQFGADADGEDDVLFVATGEPRKSLGTSVRRFGRAGGAGLRVWTDEAVGGGRWSYRLLTPPPTSANPDRAWLAASGNLFERPGAGPFAAWTDIPLPVPFSTVVPGQPLVIVTDVALLSDGADEWLYVAVFGRGVVRIKLAAGSATGQPVTPCTGITEPMSAQDRAKLGRISLATAEDGGPRVYALAHVARGVRRARLFRLAHTPVALAFREVTAGVPGSLWVVQGKDQGDYDQAVAIVPQPRPAPGTATDEVVIAGSTERLDGDWQAAVRRGPVQTVADVLTLVGTVLGRGAHADVHCIAHNRLPDGGLDRDDLWLGTDGGAYRARPAIESGRFQTAHGGIGAVQLTFLAQHPTVPAFLLAGSQDNGMLIHSGEPTWRRHVWSGDAGGTAIDPTRPRWMWQYTRAKLYGTRPPGTALPPPEVAFPPTANAAKKKAEAKRVSFYLRLAVVEVPPLAAPPAAPTPRVAFGGHRLWVSNDWGATWRTQPSDTNPLDTGTATTDQLDGSSALAVAWASPTVLAVVTSKGVYRIDGIGTAARTGVVLARQAATANRGFRRAGEAANATPPSFRTVTSSVAANVGPLPDDFVPSAVAAVDATGERLYVGLSSKGTPGADPLWFHRTAPAGWVPSELGAFLGGRTRVRSILVDPAHPEDVYAGTDVGVYLGVRTDHGAAPPTWVWSDFSFGLPEAPISDLQLWAPPGAAVRLLRAATFGRGAWEIDLERATGRHATPAREPEVFLRVCAADDGRLNLGVLRQPDPLDPTPPTAVPPPRPSGFVESPDIAVVRARARVERPWPGGAMSGADRRAWRIAAATWGHRLVPGTGAFTPTDRSAWQSIQRERLIPVTATLNERTWQATFKGLASDPDHVRYVDRYGRELAPPAPAPPPGTLPVPRWQVADPAPGINRLLVHVRNRGPLPVPPQRTEVVLLWQRVAPVTPVPGLGPAPALPHPGVVLPALPARWRVGVRDRKLALLRTDGWAVAGTGFERADGGLLFPPPFDPEAPRVVGLDLVLTGLAVGDLVALFAVVRCDDDLLPGPAIPDATDPLRTVETVVTSENRTALRVIQIRDPGT